MMRLVLSGGREMSAIKNPDNFSIFWFLHTSMLKTLEKYFSDSFTIINSLIFIISSILENIE